MAVSSLGMSPVRSSSTADTSPSPMPSYSPTNSIAMADTSLGYHTPTQQAGVTPASCSTTPSLSTPISFPAVTSTHERCDLFDEMDTLPLPQYPDCSACRVNFDFPCFATPCMECGLWFHNGCVSEHNCGSETDDDFDSYTDLD